MACLIPKSRIVQQSAMLLASVDLAADMAHIKALKQHMINRLTASISGVEFNGTSNQSDSLYTVLNVSLPPADFAEMLLFRLDIAGIAASGGSACSSGSNVGSHVLKAINVNPDRPSVRFSFSKFNTQAEIDYCIEQLQELYAVKEVQH
jgi:cysteine desulfurase